ncbi:MAG: hypothetical protein HKM94_02680, partial [Halobacteria archaeon]|nr:hypothetical protein [Halobacteria archaeon]
MHSHAGAWERDLIEMDVDMASKHALIIACSQYHNERLQQLPKTEADAAAMRDVLIDPKVCGFPREQVQLMFNEPVERVRIAIERFFLDKRPDDLLLFYFAGHGVTVGRHSSQLMLALNETDPDLKSTGIPARVLRDEIEESRSNRQVILLDCCNAAAFAGARSG